MQSIDKLCKRKQMYWLKNQKKLVYFCEPMNVEELLEQIQHQPQIKSIQNLVDEQSPQRVHLQGISTSFSHLFICAVYQQMQGNHLILLNDKEAAAYCLNDLQSIFPKKDILFLPDSFRKVGHFEELDNHQIRIRTEVIKNLIRSETRGNIIVTYPEAIIENVIDQRELNNHIIQVQIGEDIDIDFTLEYLVELGFESTDFVYEPGQFSLRGGIVDIFSYGNEKPFRIELFGNEVDSIRVFDPISQESEKKIQSITIIPNIQGNFTNNDKISFFNMLPENTCIWAKDWTLSIGLLQKLDEKISEFSPAVVHTDDTHHLANNMANFFSSIDEFHQQTNRFHLFELGGKPSFSSNAQIEFSIEPQPIFNRNFELLTQKLKELQANGYSLGIASENPRQHHRFIQIFEDLEADILFHPLMINIHEGFINHQLKVAVFTHHQIFERYHKYKLKKGYSKSEAINLKTLMELQTGDYVTHIDHGVGKYSGLETIDVNGKKQEAVRLIYKNKDILYVGINSLYKIAKFTGKEGKKPRLNKLGSDAWQRLKRKTKKKVKDIAGDLIKLYAKRRATKGFAYEKDTYLQLELESSFMYEDTPDQATTIEAVKEDMEQQYPMDRLVCGDVGFGKTEIAIRAAFKAVTDGKQVAVLVPTTILALQHYKTFKERLQDFPVEIDYLNRFKSGKEKREIIVKLANGQLDVIVGTHALVSKKVKFKDLGLLIIDEEQKFGVGVKEKLRQFKTNVDTLTLTATPIPRTLQFSLMGARDLSIMRTPPPNRQPITTEVKVFNEEFVKEAIEFEVYRGGQVFFVHNRVKDIMEYAGILQRIVPEMKLSIAHGQMDGKELEKRLMEFIDGKSDVLLCTNIVESGLDIPNANTMIVNNAHQFGLSDLHQLRGRVGRSNKKAFCYLLAPPLSTMSVDSRKRLKTLEQYSDLGSGFQIAMRDLDIRGAGNILGAQQSGFISEIGMETFHKILDEAVQDLKQTEYKELFKEELKQGKIVHVSDCQIDADVEMLIPDDYVNSRSERMLLYQELNKINGEQQLNDFGNKLRDRFGKLPNQVYELFDAIRLQWIAKKIGFERIILKNRIMKCYFIHNPDSPFFESDVFGNILAYIQAHPSSCTLKQTKKNLSITFKGISGMKEAQSQLANIYNYQPQENALL